LNLLQKLKWGKEIDFSIGEYEKTRVYHNMILEHRHRTLFAKGWHFRNWDTVGKYKSLYQHLFDPAIDKQFLRDKYLQKAGDEVLLGVHIRRGDYKEFWNGALYFDDDTYIDKIKQFITGIGKPCRIIIFTNDVLDEARYRREFEQVTVSDNPAINDHYSLWASLMGDTPYQHITTKEEVIKLEKFRVFEGNW
jgi:hypothetical protein